MPVFSGGYSQKSNPVDEDKILFADSQNANAIVAVRKKDLQKSLAGGLLGETKYFKTSGVWNKPENLKYIIVEVQAAGGGTGGAGATTTGANAAEASGGGGGEYAKLKIMADDLSATETVTVGAGGVGRSSGTSTGGTGGASQFGSHLSANGGEGGQYMAGTTGNTYNIGGLGGEGGFGDADIRITGGDGGSACVVAGSTLGTGRQSFGGGSRLSTLSYPIGPSTTAVSRPGSKYGGGSAGARNGGNTSYAAGSAGGAGIVIVSEYY